MSNNRAYLDRFNTDLREHRYAMIISMMQNVHYQDGGSAFPEENNVWVERVSLPLLKYYQEQHSLDTSGVQILVPKTGEGK